MSRDTVVWRPTPPEPEPTGHLPDRLATLLVGWVTSLNWGFLEKQGENDPYALIGDPRTMGFLEGLAASGVEGADELRKALEEHNSIDFWWA